VRALALTAAALTAAFVISACGSSSGGLIPSATAGELTTDLQDIQQAVEQQDCGLTSLAINNAQTAFDNLPSSVNARLREQLQKGFTQLTISAATACQSSSSPGGTSTGPTGPTTSTSSSSTTTSSTTTTTTSTSSSAATTTSTSSSAATTTTGTTTGPICVTNPNGGTVCEGSTSTSTSQTNGIGGAGTGGAGD
jgi:hypothetical protein